MAVRNDCEQGVGVAAQISMTCTLYSVNGTIIVNVLWPATTAAAPEVVLLGSTPAPVVVARVLTGLEPPSLILMDSVLVLCEAVPPGVPKPDGISVNVLVGSHGCPARQDVIMMVLVEVVVTVRAVYEVTTLAKFVTDSGALVIMIIAEVVN